MASKQKPTIIERDGYRCEWYARRSELECNVYKLVNGAKVEPPLAELAYPKLGGIDFADFTGEAISIAKSNEAKIGNYREV